MRAICGPGAAADPMVSDEQLAKLQPEPVTLGGLGHKAHVEDPEAVLRLLDPHPAAGA